MFNHSGVNCLYSSILTIVFRIESVHLHMMNQLFFQAFFIYFVCQLNLGFSLIGNKNKIPSWNGPYANLILENEKAAIERAVEEFMGRWNIPGLSLAISRDARLGYANAFGYAVKETGERMTMRHVARIASSFSKPTTSVAIHRLVDIGAIRLNDRVIDLITIPSSVNITERLSKLQVIHLLQHTSGGWFGPNDAVYKYNKTWSDEKLIEVALSELPLEFEPGTHFGYSNFNYFLLGKIIEHQMSVPYEEHVRNIVYSTFGMCNAYIGGSSPEDRRPLEAKYYAFEGEDASLPYATNRRRNQAAGGWVSSPLDILKFIHKLNADLYSVPEPASRPPLLRPSTIRTMLTPIPVQNDWASGWMVNSTGAVGDWWLPGALSGTTSIVYRSESPRIALVFMMNSFGRTERFWNDVFALRDLLIRTITKWPNTNPELFYDCNTLFDGSSTDLKNTEVSGMITLHIP